MYAPSLEALLETELLTQALARLSGDHKEGVAAFKEKRKAQFRGR
jgi:2-(1,2-epoxy-1,2-dihydrophenyl)acetyl-CoA isomerase